MTNQTPVLPPLCCPPRISTGNGHLAFRLSMPRVARSVATARHRVRHLMLQRGLQQIAAEAELLTSELAANAVQHATGQEFAVAVNISAGLIVVEVFDSQPRIPVVCEPDATRECGRGLATVAALAQNWGAVRCPPGKCVWFALQVPPCTGLGTEHGAGRPRQATRWPTIVVY
jgi:anti-sigma regulatory factor (Ser/Thr protein kinase)